MGKSINKGDMDLTGENFVLDSSIAETANVINFKGLQKSVLSKGILTRKDKEMILVAINAVKRYEHGMIYHTRQALDFGAKVEELIEVFEACVISRGIGVWMEGKKAVEYAKEYKGIKELSPMNIKETVFKDVEECKSYLTEENGELPQWAILMEKHNSEALLFYSNLRVNSLNDGLVSKKFKEFILVGINASESYSHGLKVHMNVARKLGASEQELAEVLLTGLLVSGGPAWIDGAKHLESE